MKFSAEISVKISKQNFIYNFKWQVPASFRRVRGRDDKRPRSPLIWHYAMLYDMHSSQSRNPRQYIRTATCKVCRVFSEEEKGGGATGRRKAVPLFPLLSKETEGVVQREYALSSVLKSHVFCLTSCKQCIKKASKQTQPNHVLEMRTNGREQKHLQLKGLHIVSTPSWGKNIQNCGYESNPV